MEKSSPFSEKFGKILSMECLIYLISRLPLNFLRSVGRLVGALIYRFDSAYRAEINRNLSRAGIYSAEMARYVAREQGAQAVGMGKDLYENSPETNSTPSRPKTFMTSPKATAPATKLQPSAHLKKWEKLPDTPWRLPPPLSTG